LVEKNTSARVAFITRLGEGKIPDEHTVLQEGDVLHLLVTEADLADTEKTLLSPPGSHS